MREAYCQCTADDFYNMLYDRLHDYWKVDGDILDLYMKMYENYIDNGLFEENTNSVMVIVDNDYQQWCEVIAKGDPDFELLKEIYEYPGQDISVETNEDDRWDGKYSFIEAVDDENNPTMFLVRY